MESAIFPDAEALLSSYLQSQLPALVGSVHVGTEVPNPRNDDEGFVRLIRTGGPRMNLVADSPQITLEAWAYSADRAYEIMKYARALVHALEGSSYNDTAFYRLSEFTGPQYQPENDIPRYAWTFIIGVRGSQLTL